MPIDRLLARGALPVTLLLFGACAGAHTAGSLASMAPDSARMARDVAWLASDAMEGRATGSAGNDSAAAGIARRFADLGLQPAWPDRAPADCATTALRAACLDGFVQPFVARSVAAAHAGLPAEIPSANVAAMVPGSDPALRGEVVVIGAHMDHLEPAMLTSSWAPLGWVKEASSNWPTNPPALTRSTRPSPLALNAAPA